MSLDFDTDGALEFLRAFCGEESPVVTAIKPDAFAISSCSGTYEELREFIDKYQGDRNIYFSVNSVGRVITGADKSTKEDITYARYLHVDVDPRKGHNSEDEKVRALDLLAKEPNPPTVVIDSGNGIQAFWKLKQPHRISDKHDIAQVEGRNRYIELAYQGDHCFNIDRIMRLPGTINVPNKKKVLAGRVPVLAKIIEVVWDRAYTLETFKFIDVESSSAPVEEIYNVPEGVDVESVAEISDHIRAIIRYGDDPSKPGRWRSRSEIVFHVAAQLRMRNVPRETIASILLNPSYKISESILEKKKSTEYALRQIKRAEERAGLSLKPVIESRPENLEECLDKAEGALANAGVEIFQMNGALVRVTRDDNTGPLTLTAVDPHWLLEKFIATAAWKKFMGKEVKPYEPKIAVAHHYIARKGEWRLPVLRGIISTPTLRRDYSILEEPGYDASSGLYFDPGDTKFPNVPEKPSQIDARKALDFIIKPFRHFPFVPDNASTNWTPGKEPGLVKSASRSVFLSALLTAIIRPVMNAAPMHIMDAPTAGTGKGKLADCVSVIITGDTAVMITLGDDETEDRKKLFSILSTGQRVIVIDNVERPIEGDALCTIMTQKVWQDRVLGKSQMNAVPTNALFIATGNNATARGDMTRRVVSCRLDSKDPHPDRRSFEFNPVEMVAANRAELAIALLTVLRAYAMSQERVSVPAMGSFEEWSFVRETLVWLGEPDPEITRTIAQAGDPAASLLTEVATYWYEQFQGNPVRLSAAISSIQQANSNEAQIGLRDLLGSLCPGGRLNVRTLTNWFRRNSGRIVNGYRFLHFEDTRLGTMIQLEAEEPPQLEVFEG